MKAAHALGMIGTPAKVAAPEIVEVLHKETDGHRRGYIARALGNTGDPNSLPVLEKALKTETDPAAQGEMRGASRSWAANRSARTSQDPPRVDYNNTPHHSSTITHRSWSSSTPG